MEDRSIWQYALSDILSVVPIPRLKHRLHLMSSRELRIQTLKMFRLHWSWLKGPVEAKRVRTCTVGERGSREAERVQFIPGGDWILVMLSDGTLLLCHIEALDKPSACAELSPSPYARRCDQLTVFMSPLQEILVLLSVGYYLGGSR